MQPRNPYLVPGAIVLAGLIIAGALYARPAPASPTVAAAAPAADDQAPKVIGTVPAVNNTDHILGNPNATIKLVEYSDLECPFCKRFHYTLKQLMDEYGTTGQVAWVYRHFPIDQLHNKARSESVAAECAAKIGGQAMFWKYMDEIMTVTPSNNGLDPAELPKIATKLGLDTKAFASCQTSGQFDTLIQKEIDDAVATGGRGTPWSIIITPKGTQIPIDGAYAYDDVKTLIDQALAEK